MTDTVDVLTDTIKALAGKLERACTERDYANAQFREAAEELTVAEGVIANRERVAETGHVIPKPAITFTTFTTHDVPEKPAEDDPDEALADVIADAFYEGDSYDAARAAREHVYSEQATGRWVGPVQARET